MGRRDDESLTAKCIEKLVAGTPLSLVPLGLCLCPSMQQLTYHILRTKRHLLSIFFCFLAAPGSKPQDLRHERLEH